MSDDHDYQSVPLEPAGTVQVRYEHGGRGEPMRLEYEPMSDRERELAEDLMIEHDRLAAAREQV